MKHEFDKYINNYRKQMYKSLALSGESSTCFAEYKAQKLQEWFPKKAQKNISILDFGCGDGLMTSFVQYFFPKAQLHGVDPSENSIKTAQGFHDSISFSVSNETIPYPDNSFDQPGCWSGCPQGCS